MLVSDFGTQIFEWRENQSNLLQNEANKVFLPRGILNGRTASNSPLL
jgi:hypothetical protein